MTDAKTVTAFDASLQRDVPHIVTIDAAGEVVLTSSESAHFFKLPAGTDAAGLTAGLAAHKAANEGQVTEAAQEAAQAEALEKLGL